MEIVIGTRRLTKKLGLFVAENCLDCQPGKLFEWRAPCTNNKTIRSENIFFTF